MSPVVRNVLAVLGGAVAGFAVVMLSDAVVGRVYPLPSGLELSNAETARAAIAAVPLVALFLLVVGWALAGGIGAFIAVRLSPGNRMALGILVAALLLLATIANLTMIPHPVWMWPASLLLIPCWGGQGPGWGRHPFAPAIEWPPWPDDGIGAAEGDQPGAPSYPALVTSTPQAQSDGNTNGAPGGSVRRIRRGGPWLSRRRLPCSDPGRPRSSRSHPGS